MGWHLDGRVAAVFGTHTHVPTADGRVLPEGTAFISDVGMTGSRTSVLGVKPEQALAALITQMPTRFETAEEDVWVMGAVVEVNRAGAGRLDRAGDGGGSGRRFLAPWSWVRMTLGGGRRGARTRFQGRHRHQQQRVEPDDVEVEPVVHGELEGDQAAPRRGPRPGAGTCVGGGRRGPGRGPRSPTRIAIRSGSSDGTWPQMLKGESRLGLVGDRAVVERVQAGVDRRPEHDATATAGSHGEESAGGRGGTCGRALDRGSVLVRRGRLRS